MGLALKDFARFNLKMLRLLGAAKIEGRKLSHPRDARLFSPELQDPVKEIIEILHFANWEEIFEENGGWFSKKTADSIQFLAEKCKSGKLTVHKAL